MDVDGVADHIIPIVFIVIKGEKGEWKTTGNIFFIMEHLQRKKKIRMPPTIEQPLLHTHTALNIFLKVFCSQTEKDHFYW